MLIGIHPLLPPDVLFAMAQMGHGDRLVIVDANFPAASVAAHTTWNKPCDLTCDAITALEAILTHLPIDTFTPDIAPIQGMQVVGDPDAIPEVVLAAGPLLKKSGNSVKSIERMAFYEAAKTAFVIIRTRETRPYGNFMIRKGVV